MALRRVAASSCGSILRAKLGLLGAVSNHQNHLLFPPQLTRQFRRPNQELFYNPNGGQFEHHDFTINADKRVRLGPRIGVVDLSDLKDPEVVEAAVFAVKKYNKQKNANLQFVRVVKATIMPSCGIKYYITVEAIDCGEKKTYKTQVLLNASKAGILELLKFELEPSNQGNKLAVDKEVGAEKKGGGGETKEVEERTKTK